MHRLVFIVLLTVPFSNPFYQTSYKSINLNIELNFIAFNCFQVKYLQFYEIVGRKKLEVQFNLFYWKTRWKKKLCGILACNLYVQIAEYRRNCGLSQLLCHQALLFYFHILLLKNQKDSLNLNNSFEFKNLEILWSRQLWLASAVGLRLLAV